MEDVDPREALRTATRRYNRTKKAHDEARDEVNEAIIAALKAGVRPTEVEEDSPYKGARIRQIARKRGVEGDQRYVRTQRQN